MRQDVDSPAGALYPHQQGLAALTSARSCSHNRSNEYSAVPAPVPLDKRLDASGMDYWTASLGRMTNATRIARPTHQGDLVKHSLAVLLLTGSASAFAAPDTQVMCSYAPSQSKVIAAISGAAGTTAATASAVAAATGLAVSHSSGLLILTGSSGYIAGTIGAPAAAAAAVAAATPVIVTVGLVVGGAAVTVELICAKQNHPKQASQVRNAAAEFSARFDDAMKQTAVATAEAKRVVGPALDRSAVEVRRMSVDVVRYANRASADAWVWLKKQ